MVALLGYLQTLPYWAQPDTVAAIRSSAQAVVAMAQREYGLFPQDAVQTAEAVL